MWTHCNGSAKSSCEQINKYCGCTFHSVKHCYFEGIRQYKVERLDYNNRSNINGIRERSESNNNTNRVDRLRQYLRNNDANLIFENGAISADEQEINTVPLVCYVKFVIFTSFEPTTKREIVHNNTKRNWPSLDCQ